MDGSWETVCTASGMINARIVAGRLEAEGIATHLKYDVAGAIYAVTIDGLGAVQVQVAAAEAARAAAILAETYADLGPCTDAEPGADGEGAG
jgi:hypothetical protein